MSVVAKREVLVHPTHGVIPARQLLDCIFALTKDGRIEHYHVEQMEVAHEAKTVRFTLTEARPAEERSRCQIIPPFVTEFDEPL